LLDKADRIRAQLAGGIKSYTFENAAGAVVAGSTLGSYVADPSELINYVECTTTPRSGTERSQPAATPTADRVRAQNVGTFVLLAEGVPFLHAGQEILRSKSTDTTPTTPATGSTTSTDPRDGQSACRRRATTRPARPALAALSDPTAATAQSDRQFAFDVAREWLKIRKARCCSACARRTRSRAA
jgi:hypothetical protein